MYMSSDWSKEQMTVLWLADRVKDHQTVRRLRNEGKFLNNSANFMTTIYPSATASWKQCYDKSREIKYFSRKQAIKRSNFEIFVNQWVSQTEANSETTRPSSKNIFQHIFFNRTSCSEVYSKSTTLSLQSLCLFFVAVFHRNKQWYILIWYFSMRRNLELRNNTFWPTSRTRRIFFDFFKSVFFTQQN